MSYAFPGEGALDYFPCRYGTSRLVFRGPRRSLERPYIAMLGGSETYGKFVPDPFPAIVEARLGLTMVNLGCVNAGIDVFLNEPAFAEVAAGARCTVVQIVGAHNLSNRFYTVHPRRNDRFIAASPLLKKLFRDVDFTEFDFTRHMLGALERHSAERYALVVDELRLAWTSRMQTLLTRLSARTILLWVANHPPGKPAAALPLQRDPTLVDAAMIAAVRSHASQYVEVVGSPLARMNGLRGMVFAELDRPAAAEVIGPGVHREVATALAPVLQALI